jgi:hypothetical protein
MTITPIASETRWETYAEAAVRLGITAEAVRAHAKRQHWPRQRPNSDPNGPVLVAIPVECAAPGKTTARRWPYSMDRAWRLTAVLRDQASAEQFGQSGLGELLRALRGVHYRDSGNARIDLD